jgi:hypothetical protein
VNEKINTIRNDNERQDEKKERHLCLKFPEMEDEIIDVKDVKGGE